MPFEKGKPKTGGRGPQTPNKRTRELVDILTQHGYDPAAQLIEWASVAKQEFDRCDEVTSMMLANQPDNKGQPPVVEAHQWAKLGLQAAVGLLPYVYPKRKPVEGTVPLTPEQIQTASNDELIEHAKRMIDEFEGGMKQ
jgi:hypothetical protein